MVVIRDKDIPETTPIHLIKKLRGLVIYLHEGVLITAFKGGKRAHRNLRKKDKVNRKKRYKRALGRAKSTDVNLNCNTETESRSQILNRMALRHAQDNVPGISSRKLPPLGLLSKESF